MHFNLAHPLTAAYYTSEFALSSGPGKADTQRENFYFSRQDFISGVFAVKLEGGPV